MIIRQDLVLINTSEKCVGGPITRQKVVKDSLEQSCIDFIMVCQKMNNHLNYAQIDSDQLFSFVKYSSTKGISKVVRSDHFTMIAQFSIRWEVNHSNERNEVYKLRDEDGLKRFNEITTKSSRLSECFRKGANIETSTNKWFKVFEDILSMCFKKIRITEKPPKNTIDYKIYNIMEEIKINKQMLPKTTDMNKHVLNENRRFTLHMI